MAYPNTETGYNIFDMYSMLQKSIRRGKYDTAAFAAKQLKHEFRNSMWNRLLVISSEDCYGIITKEIVKLRENDNRSKEDRNAERAIALMCRAKKSRDACYFACNFVLASRKPRSIEVSESEIDKLREVVGFDESGFQLTFATSDIHREELIDAAKLVVAIEHLDCDMAGFYMQKLKDNHRSLMWDTIEIASCDELKPEIGALRIADGYVNRNKPQKDEIFTSKACILAMYSHDETIQGLESCDLVSPNGFIEWDKHKIRPMQTCHLKDGRIPEWVYDCHTLKGKRNGKTDWDMTIEEQEALYPKQEGYFDEASWIYTYEDDFENGLIDAKGMEPIRKYAETHMANPVNYKEYVSK